MTTCWNCEKDVGWSSEAELEKFCNHCGVLNDRNPYPPPTKEDEMKPQRRTTAFEKVAIGEMLPGVISEVMYDQEHHFKGYLGAEDTIQPAVRFKFALDGYKFAHYSRWFKFSYAEKSNLYKIFLTKLVENAQPDFDFDLDLLKGMKVKTLWNENGDFQNLESIFPAGAKVKATDPIPQTEPLAEEPLEEPLFEPGVEDEAS